MDEALQQGLKYAERLEHPKMVVFASDGNVTVSKHISGSSLTINGERVYDLLPQEQVMSLAGDPNLVTDKVIENINALVSVFDRISNDLRTDGVEAGIESLKEFSLILFIKIMSERGKALPGCEWAELNSRTGESLLHAYRGIVRRYRSEYGDIFDQIRIKTPRILEKIVAEIGKLDFSRSSLDIKGGAYERFLSKYSVGNKSALGQYFTPRHITKMMAHLLNPTLCDTIYDPFCGTGGMLVSCYGLVRNQIEGGGRSRYAQ